MEAAISVCDLVKVYGKSTKALNGVSFEIKKGDFFALLGPNGAGKSTIIGIITSLINKTSGSVSAFGKDLDKDPLGVKQSIGLVPQEFNFNIYEKVIDILTQQAGYFGIPHKKALLQAQKYLQMVDLWDKRDAQSRTLSGGMKRRFMLARAMMHDPKILILDEPTAGVDIEIRRTIWDFLKKLNNEGVTVILTTHYLEEVEQLCKNVAIINQGKIIINTSLKKLIKLLNEQTFILDTEPMKESDEFSNFTNFTIKKSNDETLEVLLPKAASLNEVFAALSAKSIVVKSIRTKTNRVEELFVKILKGDTL